MRRLIIAVFLILIALPTPARAGGWTTAQTLRDAYCVNDKGVTVGVVVAGSNVYITEHKDNHTRVWSDKHQQFCWLPDRAFQEYDVIHPQDLSQTMMWRTIVLRWLPTFPNLNEALVLSIIYKEGKGEANPVDATGNDLRLLGYASVGPMAAVPRPGLPCFDKLTGANAKDEAGCAIFLGMFILNSAIERAHEIRNGRIAPSAVIAGTLDKDTECTMGKYAIGWIRAGSYVEAVKVTVDGSGRVDNALVYDERHQRNCWISTDNIQHEEVSVVQEDSEITPEDIRLSLALYNCSEESVLSDSCYAWGGFVYADDILQNILPEIMEALD